MKKRLGETLFQCILVIYALLWIGIVFLNLFYSTNNYACKKHFLYSNIQLFMFGILGGIFIYFIIVSVKENVKIQFSRININVLTALLFIIQVYVFYNMYFRTGWDPATIYLNAEMISKGETANLMNSYFSVYPNNLWIVYIQSILIRLNRAFGTFDSDGIFFIIIVQCLLTSLSGKLLYDSLVILGCKKYSIIGWIIFVLELGLSGWNVITYTDMMGLIFPVAIFRIYLSLKNEKYALYKWLSIIVLAYWGTKFKPTVIIIFLAIIINEIVSFLCDSNKNIFLNFSLWLKIVVLGSATVIVFSIIFNCVIQSTGLVIDKNSGLDPFHWMMMGLNSENDGAYYSNDVEFSRGFENKSDRIYAEIENIGYRLQNYGLVGLAKHIWKKHL